MSYVLKEASEDRERARWDTYMHEESRHCNSDIVAYMVQDIHIRTFSQDLRSENGKQGHKGWKKPSMNNRDQIPRTGGEYYEVVGGGRKTSRKGIKEGREGEGGCLMKMRVTLDEINDGSHPSRHGWVWSVTLARELWPEMRQYMAPLWETSRLRNLLAPHHLSFMPG